MILGGGFGGSYKAVALYSVMGVKPGKRGCISVTNIHIETSSAVLNVGYAVRAQKSLDLVTKSLSWPITQ
jgi:hypothetical protein